MTTKNFDALASLSNGKPIQVDGPDGLKQTTFKVLIVDALAASYTTDANVSPAELYKRGKLADKIETGGDIELDASEQTLIKDYIAKRWSPRVIVAVHDKVEADYKPEVKE